MQVRKRLVIYIQGFEPRGLTEYYNIFRREFARACALYSLTGKVGIPRENSKRFTVEWDVTTSGNGWQVETRYHFLRIFRQVVGVTPHQFLLATRLRQAAMALRSTDDTISGIAFAVGFGDLSTFNAAFRRSLGVSPSADRVRLLGGAG